jgi:sugar/nucleoside kinase (ribokinase family)
VNTEWTYRTETGESSLSVILIEEGLGHRAILFRKGSAPEITAKNLPIDLLSSAKILHLDGFYLDAALESARVARSFGVLVSLDGSAGESIWEGMYELLPLVDILVVARKFAQLVTGKNNPLKAGPLLQKYGASQVVITDGENGCWYWDAKQHIFQPAFKVDVVDTTGAGDTFHGAYLFANLKGLAPGRCLCFASATAALKCTKFGGRRGIPEYAQVLNFLEGRG